MKKIDYLKKSIEYKNFGKLHWLICCFSVVNEGPDNYKKKIYPYRLIQSSTNFQFINPETNELEIIEDGVIGEPLFSFKEKINITPDWASNLSEEIETSIGNLLCNHICIISSFGNKIPFITGRMNVNKIEDIIAQRLESNPKEGEVRSNDFIYVDELVSFVDSLNLIESLAKISVVAGTEKTIVPPHGLKEFKTQLLEKYKGKLNNPVEMSNFENELKAFDDEFLKGDPTVGVFLSGKTKEISRKKVMLTMGIDPTFEHTNNPTPILNSLNEGWPRDPDQFITSMNALRAASFSRGKETVKGGVALKIVFRAFSDMKIVNIDCGTKIGMKRKFNIKIIEKLIGREVLTGSGWKHIKDINEANKYVDQVIIVRSTLYCRLEGENICKHCAGDKLSLNRSGIRTAMSEISSILLNTSLKAMHGKVLSTKKMDIEEVFT